MKQYRITKYNPLFRDDKGHYLLNEWTDFSDIGEKFNGKELTFNDYLKVERSYIVVATSILKNKRFKITKKCLSTILRNC